MAGFLSLILMTVDVQVCVMSGEESLPSVQSPGSDPDTLDLSGQGLEKLSRATPELILNTTTLILDNNALSRLDNIHTYQCLEKVGITLWRPLNSRTLLFIL